VWEESGRVRFELEIKSEFNWKTESRKIRRLEIVSDKIEGGDSKREVIRICFSHPTKKNEFVWGSPWEAAMLGLKLHESSWKLTGEGKEKGRRGGAGGRLGRGKLRGAWGAAWGKGLQKGGAARALCSSGCSVLVGCAAWGRKGEEGEGEEEREKKKKKRRKRKEKNMENFLNLKISKKIKDTLWSWSKIILVQKNYMSNYK
jgi:hypothetical protein